MSVLPRLFRHLFTTQGQTRRAFPPVALDAIEQAVRDGENRHRCELRVVIETRLSFADIRDKLTPRDRARDLFRLLDIWDTTDHTGILIYINLADHAVEILADRGIDAHVAREQWESLCRIMTEGFAKDEHPTAVQTVVGHIHALAQQHYPAHPDSAAGTANPNELPDRPLLL
jgi:uncharacterized membrane protein